MKLTVTGAALSAAAMSLGACATVTRGDHTAWEVRTTPPGAGVKTSNNMQCESTPCSLKMGRRSEFDATITKPGYKVVRVHVTHKIGNGGGVGMAGNVVLGGLIGAGVDVASGAMYDLTPNPVELTLEKDDPAPVPTAATADTEALKVLEASPASPSSVSPTSNQP